MKNKRRIFAVTVFSFLCIGLLSLFSPIYCYPKAHLSDIGGGVVENDYNNRLCSGGREMLVRAGDCLYYNYERSVYRYGTFEISKNETKRIDWSGFQLLEDEIETNTIRKYQNKLYLFCLDEAAVKSYNSNEETFQSVNFPTSAFHFQEIDGGYLYLDSENRLIFRQDDTEETLVDRKVYKYYCEGQKIYYMPSGTREIRKYDFSRKTDTLIDTLGLGPMLNYFIVESGYLIGIANGPKASEVFCLNLETEEMIAEEIVPHIIKINAWNGKLYVASEKGVLSYDLESNETTVLTSKSASTCFIVDDTWVYFVTKNSVLWRVPQNGGTSERVFG